MRFQELFNETIVKLATDGNFLSEGFQTPNDVRFSASAHVEIWVLSEDLRDREDATTIRNSKELQPEEKVKMLKDVIIKVAHEKLQKRIGLDEDVTVHVELSWNNVNTERLNWDELTTPEVEEEY